MSKTLRTQTDFGIAFGRASAKAQHRENGSHAVTSSCLACAASGARGRQSALESSGEPRSGWVRSERERGRYVSWRLKSLAKLDDFSLLSQCTVHYEVPRKDLDVRILGEARNIYSRFGFKDGMGAA